MKTLQRLMQGAVAGTKYSAAQLAQITGMDAQTLRLLLTYHDAEQGKAEGWTLSLQTAVNFLAENRDLLKTGIDADELEQLLLAKELVNAAVNGTEYSAEELAALVGTDAQQLNLLYALSSEDGTDSGVKMSVQEFVEYLNTEILENPAFSGMLDDAMTDALRTVQTMVEAVLNGTAYTPGELAALLGGIPLGETDASPDENMVSLLYLYRAGVTESDPEWTMTIEQLVDYLTGELAQDDRFSDLLGEEFQSGLDEMSAQLKDGVSQMVGPNYSLLMIDTVLPVEGKETEEFFARLNGICGETFTGEYYLIGNSPMSEEMRLSFGREMWTITILTAAAIFLVVLLTFRSVLVAALLVLIVQCGVYITIATVGFQGYDIYFMATIVVQCILMGATVDYGILFTNYFRDCRKTMSVRDALANAYDGSIHTVLTSGTILVSTTGIISLCFQEPTIRQICQTISIGALCATLLILFILPGLLATFSRTKKPDAK